MSDRFVLGEALGEEAMGMVWRAYDEVLEREVALKELRAPAGPDQAERHQRMLTEARVAAQLRHPSIVAIHDVIEDDGRVLIVMELLSGRTLGDVIKSSGPVPPSSGRPVLMQVADALATAHAAGVTHRHVKPDNVFWLDSGRVVVCDFGPAHHSSGRHTMASTVKGAPGHMAPEQARGHLVGPATDVFSWGALGHELLTGTPPFGRTDTSDPSALLYRIVHEQPSPLTLPEDQSLGDVIMRALEKDPAQRPRDGIELIAMLSGRVDLSPAPPQATIPERREHVVRRPRRSKARVLLSLVAVISLTALAAVYADGGLGRPVHVRPFATESQVSSPPIGVEDESPQEGGVAVNVYRLITSEPCQELRAEPDASSFSQFCIPSGSLLAGESEREVAGWVKVSEPVGGEEGWLPSSVLEAL